MSSYYSARGNMTDEHGEIVYCDECEQPLGDNIDCHNCLYSLFAHLEKNRVLDDRVDPDKLNEQFESLHKKGAADFGMYWLKVNSVMVDAVGDVVRYTEQPAKYILTKIAYAVCEMMQREVDMVADRLEGKK